MGHKDLCDFGVTVQTLPAHVVKLSLEESDPAQRWLCLPGPCPTAAPLLPHHSPRQSIVCHQLPKLTRERDRDQGPALQRVLTQGRYMQVCASALKGAGVCMQRCTAHHLLLASEAAYPSTETLQNGKLPFQAGIPGEQLTETWLARDGACSEQQRKQDWSSSLLRACSTWDISGPPISARLKTTTAHRTSERHIPMEALLPQGRAAPALSDTAGQRARFPAPFPPRAVQLHFLPPFH